MKKLILLWFSCVAMLLSGVVCMALADGVPEVAKDTRCPVCGMFVSKYPHWIAQIVSSEADSHAFDGVKDMMAYYFSPETFGGKPLPESARVLVKDYYTQEWINAAEALYVVGSDVLGPMGHELIPFSSRAAAENFMTDHTGREILEFSGITPRLIGELRRGYTMKGHSGKGGHSRGTQ
jgi:copper chaperone NosL